MTAPFHRLLAFYSTRNPHDPQTIRLQDSLRGNLALGLDLPVALALALGRHLYLRNTSSPLSLNIHVPSVRTTHTLLDGLPIDATKAYSRREMWELGGRNGWQGRLDAVGVWALAADVGTGLVAGGDVVAFQRGGLLEAVGERRRRSREQVLPAWRGGPVSVAGHSWVVGWVFGVEVYRVKEE
ncbi:hypothetical protein EJ03DRAFT_355382 [Teratosphaeria nubilosa]|uniref:Uncharacterized protein n=1 Tax=Teratosphaeria nubilosa TaxID=161662 RepID=A0A6G1KW36_9PEZI|nr:hypothetical protein EJ03DRAFT_355382 [Teratosphaeria nubilosa]